MIAADAFLEPARSQGFNFYTGVPCSFLTPIINRVISDERVRYVGAASEGEAVAIAAGAWLAGRKTVVMCQNSGLGNTVNPLTSLNFPFRIPTLLIVTWRGQPGLEDEPQHELMGEISPDLLALMRVPYWSFPAAESAAAAALAEAEAEMERTGLPFAFLMERGAVRDDGLHEPTPEPAAAGVIVDQREAGEPPSRAESLERLLTCVPGSAAIIATTGKTGRELFTLADREQHFYQVGSMGGASGCALGAALNVKRPVIVLDGDGAALMKLGTLATIGAQRPENLIHVLLDNGVHDSTGGQRTVSATVDFAATACAASYPRAIRCDSLNGFERALGESLAMAGPHFIHLAIRPGSMARLGRPTVAPVDVARRFRDFLSRS